MNPDLARIIKLRTKGHLPIDEWGPKCAGCGTDEFRIDGYCSIECRDFHSDEDIEILGDALVKMEIRAEAAESERDSVILAQSAINAQNDRLREALTQIAHPTTNNLTDADLCRRFARAALAKEDTDD